MSDGLCRLRATIPCAPAQRISSSWRDTQCRRRRCLRSRHVHSRERLKACLLRHINEIEQHFTRFFLSQGKALAEMPWLKRSQVAPQHCESTLTVMTSLVTYAYKPFSGLSPA